MAKKTFTLGDTLAEALGKVSESGTEQISYIPLERLVSDERNFYSVEGVEELAANIELIGLQQPLRVRPGEQPAGSDAPFYGIVSGHRRAAALRILAEENPERWKTVPCIVETAGGSPELEELRLIMANSDSRRMSSIDLAKQAERVTELLYKLKEQGIEFPGRMRDHVAEACKVSKTKLAVLKVIREKLTPQYMPLYEKGKLNESCAYAIAQAEERIQDRLRNFWTPDELAEKAQWWIENKIRYMTECYTRKCEATGETCEHADVMIDQKMLHPNRYVDCEYQKCCANCPKVGTCKKACAYVAETQKAMQEAAKKEKAEQKEKDAAAAVQRAKEKAAERKKDAADWQRFQRAADAAGLGKDGLDKALYFSQDWWNDTVKKAVAKELPRRIAGTWDDDIDGYGHLEDNPLDYLEDRDDYIAAADALHCSVDYLLGRTEELTPVGGGWVSVEDRYPPEGTYCLAVDKWDVPMPSVYFRAAFMEIESKNVATRRLKDIEYWMPLPAPPTGKLWISENVIRELVEGRK